MLLSLFFLLFSILFQSHSSLHLVFASFWLQHCITLSLLPCLSLAVSACSVCQWYLHCIRVQTQTQKGQKTTFATKEALVASWSRQQQKAGTLDNHERVFRSPFAAKMAVALFLSLSLSVTHVQAHSRLLGKQGRQTLQWRRNARPVRAYTLSRAPNCSDKYEMVEMRDKDS